MGVRIPGSGLLILILLVALCRLSCQQVVWQIDSCRISTTSTGTYQACERAVECAAEVPGSNVNCSVFIYRAIGNVKQCIDTCCASLSPVPQTLTGPLVQQCYNDAVNRQLAYRNSVILGVVIPVVSVVAIIFFLCISLKRNPYTGKLVFVGALCCKRVPDFEKDRRDMERERQAHSAEKIEMETPNVMAENEKKIRKVQTT